MKLAFNSFHLGILAVSGMWLKRMPGLLLLGEGIFYAQTSCEPSGCRPRIVVEPGNSRENSTHVMDEHVDLFAQGTGGSCPTSCKRQIGFTLDEKERTRYKSTIQGGNKTRLSGHFFRSLCFEDLYHSRTQTAMLFRRTDGTQLASC